MVWVDILWGEFFYVTSVSLIAFSRSLLRGTSRARNRLDNCYRIRLSSIGALSQSKPVFNQPQSSVTSVTCSLNASEPEDMQLELKPKIGTGSKRIDKETGRYTTFAAWDGSGSRRSKRNLTAIRENIFTYPNGLTLSRIALTPVLCWCILNDHHITSLSLFAVAGLTDLLDGYIARNYPNQKSVLGSVLDPLADKFLVASLFLSLTSVHSIPGELHACCSVLI